ncbi:MAG: hypothetical protein JWQ89_216, partial [Devosia sp.]|uniref:PAS domain S-box protein n=1 Tax=Devosia sp. TaxID=1871048 RepID=UPI002603CF65
MVAETPTPTSARSYAVPIIAVLAAAAIFVVDTATPLTDGVASLYVVVVLLSFSFLSTRGVVFVSLGCSVLAITSYLLLHEVTPEWDALVRLLISVQAIGAVTFLAVRNRRATAVAEDRARLLDLTHDTIFTRDMKDRITYWNSGAESSYGWSKAEALGASSHQLMQTVFPQPLEAINAELLRTGRWEGELIHTTRHGRRLVVASRWSQQRDDSGNPIAILETNNDITERKHAEEALTRSEAYLKEAQRLSHTGSFCWNPTGEDYWSEEVYHMFEYDQSVKASAAVAFERVHPDDVALMQRTLERSAAELTGFDVRIKLLFPDDSVKYLHVVARPVLNAAGSTEFVGAVTDVTATKLAEDELAKAQAELLHVTRVTTLGELTASIAHEVNQPLAAIITIGEVSLRLLGGEKPDLDEVREALKAMIGDGRRAGEIIQRLRAL